MDGFKLKEDGLKLHIRKKFFTMRMVRTGKIVDASPLKIFREEFDVILSNQV